MENKVIMEIYKDLKARIGAKNANDLMLFVDDIKPIEDGNLYVHSINFSYYRKKYNPIIAKSVNDTDKVYVLSNEAIEILKRVCEKYNLQVKLI